MQLPSHYYCYHKPWPEKLVPDNGCAERVPVFSNKTPGGMAGWSIAVVVNDWQMACCTSILTRDSRLASESERDDSRSSP